jgi:hypothetical protein
MSNYFRKRTVGLFSRSFTGYKLGLVMKGKIGFGPFAGLDGVVISTTPQRTVVRVIFRSRPVLVELDPDMIRVPVREKVKRSSEHPSRSRPA